MLAVKQKNSSRKNLNHFDERMDRRHLISFPWCHNTQHLADLFFKSKLQQQQQTDMQSLGVQWWHQGSVQQTNHIHNPSTADIQERRKPQDIRFQRQAASSPCWVCGEGSTQCEPQHPSTGQTHCTTALCWQSSDPALPGWALPAQSRTL